eukprot:gene17194-23512_t
MISNSRGAKRGMPVQGIALTLVAGVLAGLLFGSIMMGTIDTMWQTGARHHVGHTSLKLETDTSGTKLDPAVEVATSSVTASSTTKATSQINNIEGDTIHTVITSGGSGYQNFQGRIMYGTYKLVQAMPGGEKLTGFTRILHHVKEDELMEEIPTFHAKPMHPECDTWCDFPVADRPNAVWQWIQAVVKDPSMMKGAWVLLGECDYVWMRPLQAPGDAFASNVPGQQYKFGYIDAQHP